MEKFTESLNKGNLHAFCTRRKNLCHSVPFQVLVTDAETTITNDSDLNHARLARVKPDWNKQLTRQKLLLSECRAAANSGKAHLVLLARLLSVTTRRSWQTLRSKL